MAAIIPGEIFDASCSWSGYNHQGHLALYFAIRRILELYSDAKKQSSSITPEEYLPELNHHFIELEYLEDFAIGEEDSNSNTFIYHSIHQVKDKFSSNLNDYDSALEGLLNNVISYPSVKEAYLHTTTHISCSKSSFRQHLDKLVTKPKALNDYLSFIQTIKNDPDKIKDLLTKKPGRPPRIKLDLMRLNNNQNPDGKNIHSLLDLLAQEITDRIKTVSSLDPARIDCVSIYDKYEINGKYQSYCEVNRIQELIIHEIRKSIRIFELDTAWETERYLHNRYCFLLGKLHEHIMNRKIDYQICQKPNSRERKITLDTFYNWLTTEEFNPADEHLFARILSDVLLESKEEFCRNCQKNSTPDCSCCKLVLAMDKISGFSFDEMKQFYAGTAPAAPITIQTLSFCEGMTKDRLVDHFYPVVKKTKKEYETNKSPMIYTDSTNKRYVLTTLHKKKNGDDESDICTKIIKNADNSMLLYSILMENQYFISDNWECESIAKEALRVDFSPNQDVKEFEKINQIKDVGVVNSVTFQNRINTGGTP